MKSFSRFSRVGTVAFVVCILVLELRASALTEMIFEDIFGRRLNERGMMLVDWEGQSRIRSSAF